MTPWDAGGWEEDPAALNCSLVIGRNFAFLGADHGPIIVVIFPVAASFRVVTV